MGTPDSLLSREQERQAEYEAGLDEVVEAGLAKDREEAEALLKTGAEYTVFLLRWIDNGHNDDGYTLHVSPQQAIRYGQTKAMLNGSELEERGIHMNGLSEPTRDSIVSGSVDAVTFARVLNSELGVYDGGGLSVERQEVAKVTRKGRDEF